MFIVNAKHLEGVYIRGITFPELYAFRSKQVDDVEIKYLWENLFNLGSELNRRMWFNHHHHMHVIPRWAELWERENMCGPGLNSHATLQTVVKWSE